MKVTITNESGRVRAAVKKAAITSLAHAAAYIRKVAVRSIRRIKKPSAPGMPPHSRTGVLKRGIAYAVEPGKQVAVIGPTRSAVGGIAHTHEFGGMEPPKPASKPRGFKLYVGGFGPIRVQAGQYKKLTSKSREYRRIKSPWLREHHYLTDQDLLVIPLHTERQVAAAHRVMETLPPSVSGLPGKRPRLYPARPFMGPALAKAIPRLPREWANSIRGG